MFDYGDAFKNADDLLSKRYKYANKVQIKSKTSDGVKFDFSASHDAKKGVSGALKGEYTYDNLVLDKLEYSTAGKVTGELKLKGVTDGLDLTFKAHEGLQGKTDAYAKLGTTFKQDNVNVNASVDLLNGPKVSANATVSASGAFFGAKGDFNTGIYDKKDAKADSKDGDDKKAASAFDNWGFLVGYSGDDFRVGASTCKLDRVHLSAHHKVNGDVSVAAGAGGPLPGKEGKVCFQAGASMKLGGDSSVEAKFDKDFNIGVNYRAKLNRCATLTVASSVDGKNLGKDVHQLGFSLVFEG